MIFVKLLRFISGFVSFRAYGGFAERFINLCNTNGITLWDVKSNNDIIYASTTIDGYKRIISVAKKSGMRTKICAKKGIPFILFRFRHRVGLVIGVLILIFTLSLLSGRIWLIDVSGNNIIPDEAVIAAISNAGIRIGSKRSSFNAARCAVEAESEFENIARISVNIIGSRAQIIVKENNNKLDVIDNSGCYNIVSSALEAYSGTPQIKIYNSVMKDQTLISGINQNKDETVSYVHAHGYAVGRTEKIIESSVNISQATYKIKKLKKVYHLYFLGKIISLGRTPKSFDYKFESGKYFELNNKRMPVGLFYTEYSSIIKSDSIPESAKNRLLNIENFADKAETYCKSRQLIKFETKEANDTSIKGKITCFENIGEEKPFYVMETE